MPPRSEDVPIQGRGAAGGSGGRGRGGSAAGRGWGRGRGASGSACRHFAAGQCRFGDSCRFSHASDAAPSQVVPARGGRSSDTSRAWTISYVRNYTNPEGAWLFGGSSNNMALFIQDGFNLLQADEASLAMYLGSPDRRGLQCIEEICGLTPVAAGGGGGGGAVPFLRVTLPLLRLLCHQRFLNSLTHLTSPVFAKAATTIRLGALARCVDALRAALAAGGALPAGGVALQDPVKEAALWKPAGCADVVAVTAEFLHVTLTRFTTVAAERREEVNLCAAALRALWDAAGGGAGGGTPAAAASLSRLEAQVGYLQAQDELRERQRRGREERAAGARRARELFGAAAAAAAEPPGPGEHRPGGPRHDNDKADIADIDLVPTQQEVLSEEAPFLPRNRPGTVAHLPPGPAAHRDLHFRLMRHDVVAPLIASVKLYADGGGGGAGRGPAGAQSGRRLQLPGGDAALWVYTNAQVVDIAANLRSGVHFILEFENPQHLAAKRLPERRAFWEKTRRLEHGTLVCLAVEAEQGMRLVLGIVCERSAEALAPAAAGQRPRLGISLPSRSAPSADEYGLLARLLQRGAPVAMLQSSGSFFAYRPFLRALQTATALPLAEFLVRPADAVAAAPRGPIDIPPPLHLALRGALDLRPLIRPEREAALGPGDAARLRQQLGSVPLGQPFPREALARLTTLDAAQTTALEAGLTQAVSLIQGPPGTGKTFLALQLMRVLLAARRAGDPPILVMCLTNHALDQFLEGLVAMGEREIVRVGSRSKSPKLEKFNLRELAREEGGGATWAERQLRFGCHTRADQAQSSLNDLSNQLKAIKDKDGSLPPWRHIVEIVEQTAPALCSALQMSSGEDEERFRVQGQEPDQVWRRWAKGASSGVQPLVAPGEEEEAGPSGGVTGGQFDALSPGGGAGGRGGAAAAGRGGRGGRGSWMSRAVTLLRRRGPGAVPAPPTAIPAGPPASADVGALLMWHDPWSLSKAQRRTLIRHWVSLQLDNIVSEVQRLAGLYGRVQEEMAATRQTADARLLRGAAVVGMTTSGVASLQNLIGAVGPKIVVVEEAAEVLEAHVLAGLAPSTEQLVLIGDHLQLRPKIQTFELSMDCPTRSFNLDLSLFERLALQQDFPVASLQEQHRMRPAISALIRGPVYPNLRDHPSVLEYDDVKGMRHNLFWVTHDQPEAGEEEGSSKRNAFEAAFAAHLARYLVQQGGARHSVTVLTGYVGQLLLLRQELERHMCVCVDDRDAAELAELEPEGGAEAEAAPMRLGQAVRLATVDNFQGEESDIIILSLVRSNQLGKIGFLSAVNRSNVALSRAKRGLYIIGNAECISGSAQAQRTRFWPAVVARLEAEGAIGPALPVVCQNHPQTVTLVRHLEDFATRVSDGGCSLRCQQRLPCGHACPRLCHPDDRAHKHTHCPADCPRLRACGHPCPKPCGDACGDCVVGVQVALPCGHEATNVPCYRSPAVEEIRCRVQVEVSMPRCGHTIKIGCAQTGAARDDPTLCTHPCGAALPCGHPCAAACGQCIRRSTEAGPAAPPTVQLRHAACTQPCRRQLPCGHICDKPCHGVAAGDEAKPCPPCTKACTVVCEHSRCKRRCGDVCAPCAEPCGWHCEHQGGCTLPCGAPCLRLPCDERCGRLLGCGHRCPGICGEACPDASFCIVCGSSEHTVLDPIMFTERPVTEMTEEEVQADPLVILGCGHAFPMSAMDQLMELQVEARSAPSWMQQGGAAATEERGCYHKEAGGNSWRAPAQLPAYMETARVCMLCRAPVGGLRRYGRTLNKIALDLAERKQRGAVGEAVAAGARALAALDAAVEAARAGGTEPLSSDAVAQLSSRARRILQQAVQASQEASTPPTEKVFQASRAAVARAAAGSLREGEAAAAVALMVRPQPDRGPRIQSLMLTGRAAAACMSAAQLEADSLCPAAARARQRIASGASLAPSARVRAVQVVADFVALRDLGRSCLDAADELAEEGRNFRSQVLVKSAKANLLVVGVGVESALQSASFAALLAEADAAALAAERRRRPDLLDAAEGACDEGVLLLGRVRFEAAERERHQASFDGLRALVARLRAEGTLTDEEKAEIMQAMQQDPGWHAGGMHWHTCPNGHVYAVGNCGHAMQRSSCPECGAAIGGVGGLLAAGNRAAADF